MSSKRTLAVYPNCSKGGVSSVLRARARKNQDTIFDLVFLEDRGGKATFADLDNVNLRIVRSDRVKSYLAYLASKKRYDEIRILSAPEVANDLSLRDDVSVTYEFHSSDMKVVANEIKKLEVDRLSDIVVPSAQMVDWITPMLPMRVARRVSIEENLIDSSTFNLEPPARKQHAFGREYTPLIWVGRFDQGKGSFYLPRLLATLPDNYVAEVIVSLEKDPERVGKFLYECDAMGVRDRVILYMNLAPTAVAQMYKSARLRGGWLVSTSLMESFGYSVREALACGLRVASFSLPVFTDLAENSGDAFFSPIGDVAALSKIILEHDQG